MQVVAGEGVTKAVEVLVVGGGPAGLALAAELCQRGLSVRVVAPHGPRPFAPTYGAWLDELPPWAQGCAQQVWTDVRAYTGGQATPLLRPYALLDNAALLRTLLGRCGERLTWTEGQVVAARRSAEGWEAVGAQGECWPARLIVDASGHGGTLVQPHFPGGAALQTAYGLVARFDQPPSPPGAMVWMDYRALRGAGRGRTPPEPWPTFLYAMHLGADRYFVEETSLVARPHPPRAELERRLLARLAAQGTPAREVLETEWVVFPMNAAAPDPGPILAFGAAAGRVHPISGFQVSGALADAPGVAQAVAEALALGQDAAQQGWAALWPPERRAARNLHLLGVRALLGLPGRDLPAFFGTFFGLPSRDWHAFLHPQTGTPRLARIMLKVFAAAPQRVRLALARAAAQEPHTSLRALAAASGRFSHGPSGRQGRVPY